MSNRRQDQVRQLLAQEAARLMVTESINDYQWAKEKAAHRLGIRDKYCLPQNEKIDQAAAEYTRLFIADVQAERLRQLQKAALKAMQFFQAFDPYLTGGAASGTVGEYTPILLELYPDAPEQVIQRLQEAAIPFAEQDFLVAGKARGTDRIYPKITFFAYDVPVELLIFPPKLKQHKIAGKDTPRLSLKQLQLALV